MKLYKSVLLEDLSTEVKQQICVVMHYKDISPDELNRPSSSGGWSILQCLDHLNSYGDYYLPEIDKALEQAKSNSGDAYKSGWLGDYFTKIMSPETGTKKYKAFEGHIPGSSLEALPVLTKFLHQEELLLSYLERARHFDLGSVRIPISISKLIRLKLGDTFRFLVAHNKRHVGQAERNLNRTE